MPPPLRARPTDLSLSLLAALLLPTFVVGLVVTRFVHASGHAMGASVGGAKPIGFFLPLLGADSPFANYPDPIWSGKSAALPFFLGGGALSLLFALFFAWIWPSLLSSAFGVAGRLVPLQLASIALVHGTLEPFCDLSPKSETGLAADLLGVPRWELTAVSAIVALVLVSLFTHRASSLASVVTPLGSSGSRVLFAILFWALPEALVRGATLIFVRFDLVDLSVGLLVTVLPVAFVAARSPRIFHERVDPEGTILSLTGAWIAATGAIVLWWWLFLGFTPAQTVGITWGSPGAFNNVRQETPYRSIGKVLKP